MVYNTAVNEISAKLTTCSAAPVADNAARDVSLGALLQFKSIFENHFFHKNNAIQNFKIKFLNFLTILTQF